MKIFQKGFNFSQDGPGNRLVYHLQGCNLRCPWCANPEGLAVTGGKEYEVEELIAECVSCAPMFFEGGGVTLTGGEVTLQPEGVKQLLSGLKVRGIHTAIETNGVAPVLKELLPMLDYLMMDIKHHDPEIHRRVTGLSNESLFANLPAILDWGGPIALRIPVIGGFNASEEDARAFGRLFQRLGLTGRSTVELLAYHEYGKDKYQTLGMTYQMGEEAKVSFQLIQAMEQILREAGMVVVRT
ncbi:MAG: radical SAM protein [Oscillospiraceae bacterium]|nr:radical SAM protein [Oscillospiraceae bacterium]